MNEHFSELIEKLRQRLIQQGAEVEKQIARAIEALTESSAVKARQVIMADEAIDQADNEIEEEAILLLALQQPVAVDLRFLVGVLKINNDLERIGDHAVNIAGCVERIVQNRTARPVVNIPFLAETARGMLKDTLDAFVSRDPVLAASVIRRDDILDDKNRSLIRELLTYMAESPSLISCCLELISISKNLERVGDLATNIAEDTIFIAQARVVKHHTADV